MQTVKSRSEVFVAIPLTPTAVPLPFIQSPSTVTETPFAVYGEGRLTCGCAAHPISIIAAPKMASLIRFIKSMVRGEVYLSMDIYDRRLSPEVRKRLKEENKEYVSRWMRAIFGPDFVSKPLEKIKSELFRTGRIGITGSLRVQGRDHLVLELRIGGDKAGKKRINKAMVGADVGHKIKDFNQ
jgi:hypothetical protein